MQFILVILGVAFFCIVGSAIGSYFANVTIRWWHDRQEPKINNSDRFRR